MQEIYKISENGVKEIAIGILISSCEKIPSLILTDHNLLQEIIQLVFTHMINISTEIDKNWCSPTSGFDVTMQASEDHIKIQFSADCIDRFLCMCSNDVVLKIISQYSMKLLNN